MPNTSGQAPGSDDRLDRSESRSQLRVYRWLGVLLAPAAVALAVLTPSALPELAQPSAVQSPPAVELSARALQWMNSASVDELADRLPGIGPLYAERITTHRRLFGPVTEAQTLVDLGIPARVVEQLRSQVPVDP